MQELTIEKVVARGLGLARLDGRVVFVPGALPGETLRAEISHKRKDYLQGSICEVTAPHTMRTAPPCRYYGICGGCDLQHASYELQLKIKQDILIDALKRTGGISLSSIEVTPSPMWGYRRRVRFHQIRDRLGFRKRSSSEVVQVDECMVLDARLDALLREQSSDIDLSGSVLAGEHHLGDAGRPAELLLGDSFGHKHLFKADGRVFFQSNTAAFAPILDMLHQARNDGGCALDLFSGVGTFSAFLADRFDQVIAVERDAGCLAYARENLPSRVQYRSSPVEVWARGATEQQISLLVVDPPRTGIDRKTLKRMLSWRPRQLLSVSCDPVTFARDLKVMTQSGYRIQDIRGVDLYPQTSHIEACALLSR